MGVGAGLYMCNVVVKKFTIHERYRQPDGQTDGFTEARTRCRKSA